MRKPLKLLLALALAFSPAVTEAMPLAKSSIIQIAPAEPLVQKAYYVRRRPIVRRGPRGGAVLRRGPAGGVVVRRNAVVVARPYRPWVRRPYYGTVVAGVALGTVTAVAVAATAPRAPSSNTCWYWSNSAKTRGYWDYCR